MSKLSLTLRTFSITGSVAGLFLTLGPDKMSWKYLKAIVKDKILLFIIIPKPNKASYDSSKMF